MNISAVSRPIIYLERLRRMTAAPVSCTLRSELQFDDRRTKYRAFPYAFCLRRRSPRYPLYMQALAIVSTSNNTFCMKWNLSASWEPLGGLVGPLEGLLGVSWGASWGLIRRSRENPGGRRRQGSVRRVWCAFWKVFVPSWARLERLKMGISRGSGGISGHCACKP